MPETVPPLNKSEIQINHDLTNVGIALDALIEALSATDAPKSRHRSILITELEKTRAFANYALMKE